MGTEIGRCGLVDGETGETQAAPTLGPDSEAQGAIPPAAQQEQGPSPGDGGGS